MIKSKGQNDLIIITPHHLFFADNLYHKNADIKITFRQSFLEFAQQDMLTLEIGNSPQFGGGQSS
jgi:hypothetical protein